jgi:hypothetical protein
MSVHRTRGAGGAGLAFGGPSGGTADRILYTGPTGLLADNNNWRYDSVNNRLIFTASSNQDNPVTANKHFVIANSAGNNGGWIHWAPNGTNARAAIGQTVFGGDDTLLMWADQYLNFVTGSSNTLRAQFNDDRGLVMLNGSVQFLKGANVASAGTITAAPTGGQVRTLTGTTPVDFITTTNWQAGSPLILIAAAATPINHQTGSPPGGTAAITSNTGANFTMVAGRAYPLVYDGTFWIVQG